MGGLKRYGIEVNTKRTAMYKGFRKVGRQKEAQDKGMYALYEPNINDGSYYSDELLARAKEYSDTAIVTITRFGAEGVDHTQTGNDRLTISQDEKELLEYVVANYEKVIVVVNSANTMELNFCFVFTRQAYSFVVSVFQRKLF